MSETLFQAGRNCAAVAHAPRIAFVVDAEWYFRLFMEAAAKARCSITLLGWDFDSRTPLALDAAGKPVLLGDFLNGLAKHNRDLRVRILDWDYPAVFGTDREPSPGHIGGWKPHRRVDFRFDDTHPVGGSHHQKIVVIDDSLAFSGGLDLTSKRWDTRKHEADDPRRVFEKEPYPPFHDVMVAVDGDAAEALARVARERWLNATGETVRPARVKSDPWPEKMRVDVENAEVAISCTVPATEESPGVRHVQALYLDMIERARDYIYLENQYFTSERIGQALKENLARAQGPEIIVVTRLLSHGWLEELTMTTLRTQLVRELREADVHGRFHVFYSDITGLCEGTCLDIHSKVAIVDDEWLRIGSANLSNRSMGMDTECDVTLEAKGEARVKKAIRKFRDQLIAEHVDGEEEGVVRAIEAAGTMAGAVEKLGSQARSLKKLEPPPPSEAQLAIAKVGDPEEPIFEGIVQAPVSAAPARSGFTLRRLGYLLAAIIAVALGLALAWTHTPLKEVVTRDNAMAIAGAFAGLWWAPLIVVLAYTPASFIMFPRWLITMTAVIAFGPYKGFVYAMTGVIVAGIATFLPGKLVDRDRVRRFAGPKLRKVTQFMEQKGLLAVTLVRLVPIAPFPVVNAVMGAMRVRLWQFVLGTFIGMLPGMLAATVLSDQLAAALEDPARVNPWLIGAAVLALMSLAWFGQRMLRRQQH